MNVMIRNFNGKPIRIIDVQEPETHEGVVEKLKSVGFEILKDEWPTEIMVKLDKAKKFEVKK